MKPLSFKHIPDFFKVVDGMNEIKIKINILRMQKAIILMKLISNMEIMQLVENFVCWYYKVKSKISQNYLFLRLFAIVRSSNINGSQKMVLKNADGF